MRIDRAQAEALAAFIIRVRTDWSHGGVMAAIGKVTDADPLDIARALVNLAADPTALTPALLEKPGPWWRNPESRNVAPPRNSMRCHDHPDQVMPCATCRAELVPATPEQIAGHMAAIRAATASGLATIKDERERTRARGAALHAHDQTRSVPFPAPQQGPQRRPGLDGHSGTPETRKARKSDERDAT